MGREDLYCLSPPEKMGSFLRKEAFSHFLGCQFFENDLTEDVLTGAGKVWKFVTSPRLCVV